MLWAFRIRPNFKFNEITQEWSYSTYSQNPNIKFKELTKKKIETRQILLSLIINCWGQAPFLQISLKISVLRLGEQIKRYFSSMYLMSMNKNYKRLLVSRISVLFKDCFRKGLGKERQRRIWKLNSWLNQNQQNE